VKLGVGLCTGVGTRVGEVGCRLVYWIHLAEVGGQYVYRMNLQVSENVGNFLTN